MKSCLSVDLKEHFLDRDIMRLLRETIKLNDPQMEPLAREQKLLHTYKQWIERLAREYPTTLLEDEKLLEKVQSVEHRDKYHWMY